MDLNELKGKAEDAVKSAIGNEERTDSLLDKVADAAKKVSDGKFDEQIDAARDAVDEKVGE